MTDDGERFYRIVLADVNGKATDEEAEALRRDIDSIREWRAVLVRMLQDAEAALSKIRADVDMRQSEAISRGGRAKDEFFRFKAERERERAGIIAQKAAIVERLKEAKDAVATFGEEHNNGTVNTTHGMLARVEAKLDRVLALLEKTQ